MGRGSSSGREGFHNRDKGLQEVRVSRMFIPKFSTNSTV